MSLIPSRALPPPRARVADLQELRTLEPAALSGALAQAQETLRRFEALLLEAMGAVPWEAPEPISPSGPLGIALWSLQAPRPVPTAREAGNLRSLPDLPLLPHLSPPALPAEVALRAPATAETEPPKAPAPRESMPSKPAADLRKRFLEGLREVAEATGESLGVSPRILLAHAALESGWGRRSIKDAAGQETYNYFGLKASPSWKGATAEILTTEYVDGVPRKQVERFRAYATPAEAFADYARLLRRRYGPALERGDSAADFGQALQAGGYATDPAYATKLARVAQSVERRMTAEGRG